MSFCYRCGCWISGSNTVESSPIKSVASPTISPDQLLLDLEDAAEEPSLLTSLSEPGDEVPGDEVPGGAQPPSFFRSFVFSPEVPIRLDYQGKHVDMDQVERLFCLRQGIILCWRTGIVCCGYMDDVNGAKVWQVWRALYGENRRDLCGWHALCAYKCQFWTREITKALKPATESAMK